MLRFRNDARKFSGSLWEHIFRSMHSVAQENIGWFDEKSLAAIEEKLIAYRRTLQAKAMRSIT